MLFEKLVIRALAILLKRGVKDIKQLESVNDWLEDCSVWLNLNR